MPSFIFGELIKKLEKVDNKDLIIVTNMYVVCGVNDYFEEGETYLVLTDSKESTMSEVKKD